MNLHRLSERLIKYERWVLQVYRALSEREELPPAVRSFWQQMTEDERTHLAALEHSAGSLNLMASPPVAPETAFADLEATIVEAEAAGQRSDQR